MILPERKFMEWQLSDNKREYIIFMPLQNTGISCFCWGLADFEIYCQLQPFIGNIFPAVESYFEGLFLVIVQLGITEYISFDSIAEKFYLLMLIFII